MRTLHGVRIAASRERERVKMKREMETATAKAVRREKEKDRKRQVRGYTGQVAPGGTPQQVHQGGEQVCDGKS